MKKKSLKDVSKKYASKLKKIKVLLFDVDGILTDGRILYDGSEVGFNRIYNIYDGYGIRVMINAGIKVGFISGAESVSIKKRAEVLGVNYLFLGNEDKREAYKKVLSDGYKDSEILYMGDELFDIPLLKRAGFSATVPEAFEEVKKNVDYITDRLGGRGAVREVIDMVRYAQKIYPKIPEF